MIDIQRYNLIEVGGFAGKAMAQSEQGRWVKHDDLVAPLAKQKHLDNLATEMGYDSVEAALTDLLTRIGN